MWKALLLLVQVVQGLYSVALFFVNELRIFLLSLIFDSNVCVLNKKFFRVQYTYKQQSYYIPVRNSLHHMTSLVKATTIERDGNERDVTTLVRSYLGPCEDWHCATVTPSLMGLNNLHMLLFDFVNIEDKAIQFAGHDVLPSADTMLRHH